MLKFQFPISEIKRATATILLSAGVAVAYIAVMTGGTIDPAANATTWANSPVVSPSLPERPAGGRRWRSSNAEQSRPTRTYYGTPDAWGRNRAALEGAMTLFQMGDTFSSKEIAGGTATVTLNRDHLAAYLATPFLGGEATPSFALDHGVGQAFVVAQVLTRAFAAEQLAQNRK
jgi:hypothetical protein